MRNMRDEYATFFDETTSCDSLSTCKIDVDCQFINTNRLYYYATIISDSTSQTLLPSGAIGCIAISPRRGRRRCRRRRRRVTPLLETCVPFPEEAGACGHKKGHSFLWTLLHLIR